MFQLINTQTNEVAFIGKTPTECKSYAIKKKIFTVERSKNFKHIICGYWDIQRVK
jgi:hypothetical protein